MAFLQIHPEVGRCTEPAAKPQGRVCRNAATTAHEFVHAVFGHLQLPRKLCSTDANFAQFVPEDGAGMDRYSNHYREVFIDNQKALGFQGYHCAEAFEAHTPLLVYTYAELACPIPTWCFKTIAWQGNRMIGQFRLVQNFQTLSSLSAEVRKRSNKLTVFECFGSLIPIAPDHGFQR